jgi:hypothetical protein
MTRWTLILTGTVSDMAATTDPSPRRIGAATPVPADST